MKIKISKSQLINILNEEEKNLNLSDKEKFGLFDAGLRALASNSDDPVIAALGNAIISSQLDDSEVDDVEYMDRVGDLLPLNPGSFKVTSGFGRRNIGVGKSKNHQGIDLGVKSGTEAFAVADGTVTIAGNTQPNGCGGHVRIKHKGDYETKYCHLKQWVVNKGDVVRKAQLIGYTGGDQSDPHRGNSTGAHLHYEVVKGGTKIDPKTIHTKLA